MAARNYDFRFGSSWLFFWCSHCFRIVFLIQKISKIDVSCAVCLLCFFWRDWALVGLVNQYGTKGEAWSTANKVKPPPVPPRPPQPSNCIVDRPKAARLFWLFCCFGCGLWLSSIFLVYYFSLNENTTYHRKIIFHSAKMHIDFVMVSLK